MLNYVNLEVAAIASLLNISLLILLIKVGFIGYAQMHFRYNALFRCEFCMFFWFAFIEYLSWFHITNYKTVITLFLSALYTAALSRFFYK